MNLNQTQREQLARVLEHLYDEEKKDYRYARLSIEHDGGTPGHHVFEDVKSLSDMLTKYNHELEHCLLSL